MARRKREPMSEGKKNIIAELIEEYDTRTAKDIEDALKDLMGGTIQEMLEAELVGPGLKSGVRIRMDNPAQLGGELLCAAVGALQTHKPPLLVMNMDTAATLVAVDAEGSIVGGVILPSPALSLSALVRNTAQLPQIDMELPAKRFLGTNTTDCLHSGIVNGSALMLDGLFARCRATLHAPDAPVIATGTLPASIRDACATPIEYNGTLILDGLYSIWKRNVKK